MSSDHIGPSAMAKKKNMVQTANYEDYFFIKKKDAMRYEGRTLGGRGWFD